MSYPVYTHSKSLQSLGLKIPKAAGYLITEGGSNRKETSVLWKVNELGTASSKDKSALAIKRKGKWTFLTSPSEPKSKITEMN